MNELTMYEKIALHKKDKSIALEYFGTKMSYAQLINEVDRACCKFKESGLKKGDCIGIALANGISAIVLIYGANKAGIVCNMIHPLLPCAKLIEQAKLTGCKILFVESSFANNHFEELSSNESFQTIVCYPEDYVKGFGGLLLKLKCSKERKNCKSAYSLKQFLSGKVFETKTEKNDLAMIMHGGGTTGEPKAIMHTNKNFNANADGTLVIMGDEAKNPANKAMLAVLPLYHAYGFGLCIHTMLSYGFKIVLVPKYTPQTIINLIKRKKLDYLAGVPTIYRGLILGKNFQNKGLKNLKLAFSGGDRLPDNVKINFELAVEREGGACKLLEGYGLTEVCGAICANTLKNNQDGSKGQFFSNLMVESFDGETMLNRGDKGELCISGDAVCFGYYNDEQATKLLKFEHSGRIWLRTGDWGYVDSNDFVFVTDRIKRIVKVSGITVFPAEVEKVVETVEGVSRCVIVPAKHEHKGEVLKAIVQLKENFDQREVLESILEHCEKHLGKWEMPKIISFEEIPLTKMGKIDFIKLKED